jgi:hypothetical protein
MFIIVALCIGTHSFVYMIVTGSMYDYILAVASVVSVYFMIAFGAFRLYAVSVCRRCNLVWAAYLHQRQRGADGLFISISIFRYPLGLVVNRNMDWLAFEWLQSLALE